MIIQVRITYQSDPGISSFDMWPLWAELLPLLFQPDEEVVFLHNNLPALVL